MNWGGFLEDFLSEVEEFGRAKISIKEAYIARSRYLEKFVIATGAIEEAKNLILVTEIQGNLGVGEAPIDGLDETEVAEKIGLLSKKFSDNTLLGYIDFLKESRLENWLGLAFEMSILDAIAKAKGVRYGDLFSKSYVNTVETDVTIGIRGFEETLKAMKKFVSMGFRVLKVKVGLDLEGDKKKVEALIEESPEEVRFRIDANQGYTESEALDFIRFANRFTDRIELIEQPLKKDNLESIGRLREHTEIPIIVDESVRVREDVERVFRYVDGVNLKPIKSGGILEISYSFHLAKELSLLTMIGCSSESNIGITSSTYIASTHKVDFADLDSDILQEPILKRIITKIHGGYRVLPEQSGLGVSPDDLDINKLQRIF